MGKRTARPKQGRSGNAARDYSEEELRAAKAEADDLESLAQLENPDIIAEKMSEFDEQIIRGDRLLGEAKERIHEEIMRRTAAILREFRQQAPLLSETERKHAKLLKDSQLVLTHVRGEMLFFEAAAENDKCNMAALRRLLANTLTASTKIVAATQSAMREIRQEATDQLQASRAAIEELTARVAHLESRASVSSGPTCSVATQTTARTEVPVSRHGSASRESSVDSERGLHFRRLRVAARLPEEQDLGREQEYIEVAQEAARQVAGKGAPPALATHRHIAGMITSPSLVTHSPLAFAPMTARGRPLQEFAAMAGPVESSGGYAGSPVFALVPYGPSSSSAASPGFTNCTGDLRLNWA